MCNAVFFSLVSTVIVVHGFVRVIRREDIRRAFKYYSTSKTHARKTNPYSFFVEYINSRNFSFATTTNRHCVHGTPYTIVYMPVFVQISIYNNCVERRCAYYYYNTRV